MAKKGTSKPASPEAPPAPASPEAPAAAPADSIPATAAPEAPVVKVEEPEQNGVRRPSAGTTTRRVWEIADMLSQQHGRPAKRKEVIDACVAESINASTATTQFGKWCKFFGLVEDKSPGRAAKAAEAPAPAAPVVPPPGAPAPAPAPAVPNPFDVGYEAYSSPQADPGMNPHVEGTAEHSAWINGWNTAAADAAAAAQAG